MKNDDIEMMREQLKPPLLDPRLVPQDQKPLWMIKDRSRITPDMKRNENCPCPETAEITYECEFHGYCELCKDFHKRFNWPYCSLPPGKDQYLVPWEEGTAVSNTYAAIKIPQGAEKTMDCPCPINCCYNGYCIQCKQHTDMYNACTTSCDKNS